ncbi:glycolipid transfer protein 3-like [Sesbania bispinosa]|nr:glycolipid transfer protein 3-like [Sesbania bispinosa]
MLRWALKLVSDSKTFLDLLKEKDEKCDTLKEKMQIMIVSVSIEVVPGREAIGSTFWKSCSVETDLHIGGGGSRQECEISGGASDEAESRNRDIFHAGNDVNAVE